MHKPERNGALTLTVSMWQFLFESM